MNAIFIRAYQKKDVPAMTTIWNEVVQDGIAFPQEEFLTEEMAQKYRGGEISREEYDQWRYRYPRAEAERNEAARREKKGE